VNRAAAQCGLGRGTCQTQQRQRRARQRRIRRAFVIGVQRHVLTMRFEVHAERSAVDMHGKNLFSEALAEYARRRRRSDIAIQQRFQRREPHSR
jgi:hypothetical protein